MVPSPIYQILADSSDSDAVCISHQFMEEPYLQPYNAFFFLGSIQLFMGQNKDVFYPSEVGQEAFNDI